MIQHFLLCKLRQIDSGLTSYSSRLFWECYSVMIKTMESEARTLEFASGPVHTASFSLVSSSVMQITIVLISWVRSKDWIYIQGVWQIGYTHICISSCLRDNIVQWVTAQTLQRNFLGLNLLLSSWGPWALLLSRCLSLPIWKPGDQ